MASQRPSPPGDAIAAGRADARRFQTSFPDIGLDFVEIPTHPEKLSRMDQLHENPFALDH